MSIKQILAEDYKTSIKEHDTIKKNVVTMVRAAVLQVEKDEHVELEDDKILEIIEKQVKQRKDSLAEFVKAGREDLINETEEELKYLYGFLPEQLSEEELEKIVAESLSRLGITEAKQMGVVMSDVMPKVKGRADGKAVNAAVKKLLNK